MRSCTASCRASTRSSEFRQSTQALLTALWSHRCPWIRYSASSTAARWPQTTPSGTTGVPCSCCLVRSGLATPERRWRSMRAWTVSSWCSTRDARATHRRRRRALELSVPPMVLSDRAPALTVGSTGWATTPRRAWHPSASLRPTAPHGTATAEFASLRHRHARNPRRDRGFGGRPCSRPSFVASPFGQSPGSWASTEHGPQVRRSQEPAHDAHQGQVPRITARWFNRGLDGHFP